MGPGSRFGSYEVTAIIGQGGMGEVYRARDERLDRDVAIKVLPASSFEDPIARARLLQEARAAAALNHPHICTVYEVGEADGQTYIAMELVEGQPLNQRLKAGPLPAQQVVRYGRQLADALAHAHERGVVHRDLKSANIIVRPDGRVKVLDFGLAKRLTATELTTITRDVASLTQPGTVMGTVAYMAPEQLRGAAAQRPSDIWALGVVLHEMASGGLPFIGQTGFELSAAILSHAPAPLPSTVPRPLRTVVARCLEKEPGQRYQAGSEVHAALEALHDVRADAAEPTAVSEAPTVLTKGATMKMKLFVVGFLVLSGAGATTDLYACGAKFLMANRGTRFGRVAAARHPAAVLVYANPASVLPEALRKVKVEKVLGRAGYRPTVVSDQNELEQALSEGGWDIVVADLADSGALRARLRGENAPMIVPRYAQAVQERPEAG